MVQKQAAAATARQRPFYGWAIVAVGIAVAFSSGPGQSYGFSVFLDSIIEATGFSRTGVSTLYAIGTGVSAVMVMLVSRLADRRGPRLMLIVVGGGLGLACFLMAVATGPFMIFFAFAALRALGQGSLPVNSTLLVAQWFYRYRGRAMAIVGLGFAASNAIIPPLGRFLIDTVGWRSAYAVFGVMVWVLVLPAAILVVRNRPEEMGLFPDGASEPPAGETRVSTGPRAAGSRRVLTSRAFWQLAVPMSAPSLIVTALVFHQVSIFGERGVSESVAAGVFIFYAIASASTGLLAGFLVDRFGPKLIFVASLSLLFVAMLTLQVTDDPLLAGVYAAILGVSGGMQSVVSGVTWVHYYGREGLGRVQGSAMMVSITGAALGPLPLAAFRDVTGSYSAGVIAMLVLLAICIALAAFASPRPEALRDA
jgi:MFS family permease